MSAMDERVYTNSETHTIKHTRAQLTATMPTRGSVLLLLSDVNPPFIFAFSRRFIDPSHDSKSKL